MDRLGIVLVILGSVLWGTDSLFRRPLTRHLSPVTLVFLEHLILVTVMLPALVRARRPLLRLNAKDWIALVFIALGGSVAATSLFTFAVKYGNPSVTMLLQKTQPFFTIFLARLFLHERPGGRFWLLLPPALLGAYLVSTPDWRGFVVGAGEPVCILAAIAASCLWGAATVFGRYIVTRLPVPVLTGLRFALALPVLAFLYAVQDHGQKHLPSDLGTWAIVAAMAMVPGLAALVCYYKGLQSTLASVASLGELAFPLTAVIVNWSLLGVRLTASQLAGGVLLISSVTVLAWINGIRERRSELVDR